MEWLEDDPLDTLEDLFDDELGYEGPTAAQLYQLYGVFLNTFKGLEMEGKPVVYNRNPSRNPLCRGKAQAFEHIITRESKMRGKREFDRSRANKIHWIRVILENSNDARVKCFERIHLPKSVLRKYYWYKDKHFVVILEDVAPDILLITAYSVDQLNQKKYAEYYQEFLKQKETPRRT